MEEFMYILLNNTNISLFNSLNYLYYRFNLNDFTYICLKNYFK